MADKCEVYLKNGKITVELPLTKQTSLVRIKDKNGLPVGSVRNNQLLEEWFLEWQVSYFDADRNLTELGKMLKFGIENKIIDRSDLDNLHLFATSKRVFFDNLTQSIESLHKEFEGFSIFNKKIPILRKFLPDGSFIHIELQHRQRAVGFQPMLYIFIPLKNVEDRGGNNIVGRNANKKEIVFWYPQKTHILELLKGFVIMSESHKRDIIEILDLFR